MWTDGFTIKDSGVRESYAGGMVRDTADKGVCWSNIYYGPMAYRWATHTTRGRQKYEDPEPGIPNWTLGRGLDVWLRAQESLERHVRKYIGGHQDEDHAAAIFFNVNLAEYVFALLTPAEKLAAIRIQMLRNDEPYDDDVRRDFPWPPPIMFGEPIPEGRTAGDCGLCDGDPVACDCALDWVKPDRPEGCEVCTSPCTCTIACIPAGITEEQHCKEGEGSCGPVFDGGPIRGRQVRVPLINGHLPVESGRYRDRLQRGYEVTVTAHADGTYTITYPGGREKTYNVPEVLGNYERIEP